MTEFLLMRHDAAPGELQIPETAKKPGCGGNISRFSSELAVQRNRAVDRQTPMRDSFFFGVDRVTVLESESD
ncbi:MAG TPA: hypothetical protein VJ603_07120 [Paucimonas sp.]|nr:hypothetical protein [Paucimonas sp.]HJW54111.1 hypothetical protein [Burkholderiaceae bacterium]